MRYILLKCVLATHFNRFRGLKKNFMKRGQTDKLTSQLYERIGLRSDSLKRLAATVYIILKHKVLIGPHQSLLNHIKGS